MLVGLRDPLSRIELALERGSLASGPGPLALEIRAALGEADGRLEEALRVLRGDSGAGERSADCRAAVRELAERLRAPLAARGLGFELSAPGTPVPGDPALLRRALLCLLRTAAGWAGAGGSIHVRLAVESSRYGLHALVSAPPAASGEGFASEALERFALAAGGMFAADPAVARAADPAAARAADPAAPSALSLALWLPERAAA
jgi:signal transduction histidine kinase